MTLENISITLLFRLFAYAKTRKKSSKGECTRFARPCCFFNAIS